MELKRLAGGQLLEPPRPGKNLGFSSKYDREPGRVSQSGQLFALAAAVSERARENGVSVAPGCGPQSLGAQRCCNRARRDWGEATLGAGI